MNLISARCSSSLVGGLLLLCTLCSHAIDRDMPIPRPAGLEKITLHKESIIKRLHATRLAYLCEGTCLPALLDRGSCYPYEVRFFAMEAVVQRTKSPNFELSMRLMSIILADQPVVLKRLKKESYMYPYEESRENKGEEKNKK